MMLDIRWWKIKNEGSGGSKTKYLVSSLPLICLLLFIFFVYQYIHLPDVQTSESPIQGRTLSWAKGERGEDTYWSVFRKNKIGTLTDQGSFHQRFRLAGTFFSYGVTNEKVRPRKAILDDLRKNKQVVVEENERLEDVKMAQIFQDRVVLYANGHEEELWLSFSGSHTNRYRDAVRIQTPTRFEDMPALETNRFGKKIGTYRWVFQREALIDYFNELTENPERIAAMYVSMKPARKNDRRISGYYLDMAGEEDFFKTVGLQQGDIIRSVNSLKLTSQSRGEFFLKEFIQDRLGAAVLDVERNGQTNKLIYLVR
ncbi:MAG: hypothetical protein GKR87_15055 [Kiritimatiellae bacterium]|nr:hypothetical protein [Kiritimatiellia bacterium]